MKVLCLLQNAWGDRQLPPVFKPNEGNKSAKTLRKIIGKDNIMHFCNTTIKMTETASGIQPAEEAHVKHLLVRAQRYDVLLVCGKQAKSAFNKWKSDTLTTPVIFMKHPAARNLSNVECAEIREQLLKHIKVN